MDSGETKKRLRILSFDLNSGIWPHTMLLNKALGQLDPEKFDISVLACGSLFRSTCAVSESRKRTFDKDSSPQKLDCTDCTFTSNLSSKWLFSKGLSKGPTEFLSGFISDSDRELAESLSIEICQNDLDLENKFLGIPIVRFALYESLLKFKKLNYALSAHELEHFKAILENCILTVLASKKFFELEDSFDLVVIHSPEYGVNNCFASVATQCAIKVYALRGSFNLAEMYSSVVIHDWHYEPKSNLALRSWTKWQDVEPKKSELAQVKEHREALSNGKSPFVYSSRSRPRYNPQSVKNRLGIKNQNKTILLALNSTDEIIAGKTIGRGLATNYPGIVFNSQFEWVSQTMNWIASRKDLNLVVRLHPRDVPNKRESVLSEQYSVWKELLEQRPSNVFVNYPSQKISFEDVCEISSVVASGWSATCLEAMLMQRPVVTYDSSLPALPADVHRTGSSKAEYFDNLTMALSESPNTLLPQKALRWMTHSLSRDSVRLTGGLFQKLRSNGPVLLRKVFSALDRYVFFIWRPLELNLTFRLVKDRERIENLFLYKKKDFYNSN